MSIKKIFIILISIVACVIIGALILNILLPNTARAIVNAVEDNIYKATGMQFDFNGDGQGGTNRQNYSADSTNTTTTTSNSQDNQAGVDGWD